jgi:hypothetical protein
MSDFNQNRHSPGASVGPVWSLAALSIALLLCSVLATKLIGDKVDLELTQVADALASSGAVRKSASRAIDPVTTGSIPRKDLSGGSVAVRGQAAR